ncbi:unnamed protein product [Ranitomeya imitator]|uniref:Paraoxonase n=1 Tax=Ranitomeya imitator TaxID=111125 RepID=A0ABN9MC53_9NEOB|nr:unnamed protein product [Ranitomeya imitator]
MAAFIDGTMNSKFYLQILKCNARTYVPELKFKRMYIYVADLTGRTVNVFEKHANWSLSPVKVVELETLLDNLSVDPVTGDVWTGGTSKRHEAFLL